MGSVYYFKCTSDRFEGFTIKQQGAEFLEEDLFRHGPYSNFLEAAKEAINYYKTDLAVAETDGDVEAVAKANKLIHEVEAAYFQSQVAI